jgi:hypothetical protein
MTYEVETDPDNFRQHEKGFTDYCGKCGTKYDFLSARPLRSPCCSKKLHPEGGDEFAIALDQVELGLPFSK